MSTFKDDIKNILSESEPIAKNQKESIHMDNSIRISNCILKNNSCYTIITSFIALCFISFVAFFYLKTEPNNQSSTLTTINSFPSKQPYNIDQMQIITSAQADEIKKLVKEVSACQNKAPITVHNDLKKIFKYYRYREIDLATYDKIMVYLKSQNCQ